MAAAETIWSEDNKLQLLFNSFQVSAINKKVFQNPHSLMLNPEMN